MTGSTKSRDTIRPPFWPATINLNIKSHPRVNAGDFLFKEDNIFKGAHRVWLSIKTQCFPELTDNN